MFIVFLGKQVILSDPHILYLNLVATISIENDYVKPWNFSLPDHLPHLLLNFQVFGNEPEGDPLGNNQLDVLFLLGSFQLIPQAASGPVSTIRSAAA